MLLDEVAATWEAVGGSSGRLAKVGLLAECLRHAGPDEVPMVVAYLSGELPQGTIGVGWAALQHVPGPASGEPTLGVREVHETFERIRATSGAGSQAARRELLAGLFGRAMERERRFLFGLLSGELRQGALGGVMIEAVAKASGLPASHVRRGVMLAGDVGVAATAALADGAAGLARFRLMPLHPVRPMLAQTADDIGDALARINPAAVEWKLDGARLQVHRRGEDVAAFTRTLADVTDRVPEIVEGIRDLPVDAVVLDGEAIALREDGRPHPFQTTMSRFGSRLDVERLRSAAPLSAFFFDCLHVDGDDLIDWTTAERFEVLAARVPEALRVPRIEAQRPDVAQRHLDDALARGHEGVMVKALEAPYEAGRRGASWLKVKVASTLDLVILAAEWGHGRRRGWLSNLHLGARDPATGEFVMLGKTFKGLTDQMLSWQTERLQELETGRDAYTVYVRPELVVEVAFDGVQASSRYPGGVALRFARVKGYRPDKRPGDTDTIDTVLAIHAGGGSPDVWTG